MMIILITTSTIITNLINTTQFVTSGVLTALHIVIKDI